MKKSLSLLLCVLLVLSLFSTMAFADGTPTISVSDGSCKPGETVDLDVSFTNNPGIASMTITPSMPKDSGFKWKAEGYNGAFGTLTAATNCQFNNNAVNYTQDGKFMTLKVTVPEETTPGDYAITIKFRSAASETGKVTGVACTAGTLTVESAVEPDPTVALKLAATGDGHVAYGKDTITATANYADIVPGTAVALSAVSDGGDFLYWKDNTNSKIYSDLADIQFNIVENVNLTAVFTATAGDTRMVTYKNTNGAIIKAEEVAEGATLAAPETNPTAYGYKFVKWSLTEDEIAATAGDVIVVAVYEHEDIYFTVNVTGGSVYRGQYGKDENADKHLQLTQAFVKADAAAEGMKFAYWKNAADEIVNYNEVFDFYVTNDIALEAVFVAATEAVDEATVINVKFTAADTLNNKLSFTSERFVAEGETVASHGIILTSNATVGADVDTFVIGGEDVLKGTASTSRPTGKYTLTKKNCGNATWYARAYVITVDALGTVNVTYSAIASGSLN